jgi:hypothetical protein
VKFTLFILFILTSSLGAQDSGPKIYGPQIDQYYKYQREYLRMLFYSSRDYCLRATKLIIKEKSLPVIWGSAPIKFSADGSGIVNEGENFLSDEDQRVIAKNYTSIIKEKKFLSEHLKTCPNKSEIAEACQIFKEEPTAFPVGTSPDLGCQLLEIRTQIRAALLEAEELKQKLERGEIDANNFTQTVLGTSSDLKQKISSLPFNRQLAVPQTPAASSTTGPVLAAASALESKSAAQIMENKEVELEMRNQQQAISQRLLKEISTIEEKIQRLIIDGEKDSKSYDELLKTQTQLRQEALNSNEIAEAHKQKIIELDLKLKELGNASAPLSTPVASFPEGEKNGLKEGSALAEPTNSSSNLNLQDIKPAIDSLEKFLGLDRFRSRFLFDGKGDGDL